MLSDTYAFIPIAVIITIAYLITWYLYKQHVITKRVHRQLWNTMLLLCFLGAGAPGMLLVIQVNYKLAIPGLDKILTWHVDLGIAFFLIALFHLSWHLHYYGKLFKRTRRTGATAVEPDHIIYNPVNGPMRNNKHLLLLPAAALGFITLMAQVILIREFLAVFNGNELIVGVILTNWMVITALGAALGKYIKRFESPLGFIYASLISISLLPVLTAFLINYIKNTLFPLGAEVGIYAIFFSSFFLLLPFCLVSGLFFSYLSHYVSALYRENYIPRVYATEALGSIVGGLVFNLALVFILSTFQSLLLLAILGFLILLYMNHNAFGKKSNWFYFAVPLALLFACLFLPVDKKVKSLLHPNQEIALTKNTPSGNITVTKKLDQKNVYVNNALLFTTDNLMIHEESVHFAMVQHPGPGRVLVISGGVSGRMNEILKYRPAQIHYVEFDPWIITYGKDFFRKAMESDSIRVILQDPRRFVRTVTEPYDVVIMNLPDPDNAQLNRYYTVEFFTTLKHALANDGVLSLSLKGTVNYIGGALSEYHSVIFRTLREVFEHAVIIPGEKNYFVASDMPLTNQVISGIEKKGIKTEYVNSFYLNEMLLVRKSRKIMQSLTTDVPVNSDFKPVSYHQRIQLWMNQFTGNFWIIAGILLLILIFLIIRLNPVSMGILTIGFSASSLELIIILSIQILYGNLYYMAGLVFTVFMAGLALGSGKQRKLIPRPDAMKMAGLQLIFALLVITVLGFIILLQRLDVHDAWIFPVFFALIFLSGVMGGLEFSLGSQLLKGSYGRVSGELYGVDLFGSAIGALVVSIYLIPLMGISRIIFMVFLANLISAFYIFTKRKVLV